MQLCQSLKSSVEADISSGTLRFWRENAFFAKVRGDSGLKESIKIGLNRLNINDWMVLARDR